MELDSMQRCTQPPPLPGRELRYRFQCSRVIQMAKFVLWCAVRGVLNSGSASPNKPHIRCSHSLVLVAERPCALEGNITGALTACGGQASQIWPLCLTRRPLAVRLTVFRQVISAHARLR